MQSDKKWKTQGVLLQENNQSNDWIPAHWKVFNSSYMTAISELNKFLFINQLIIYVIAATKCLNQVSIHFWIDE